MMQVVRQAQSIFKSMVDVLFFNNKKIFNCKAKVKAEVVSNSMPSQTLLILVASVPTNSNRQT
jgi:hypothetical protein